MNDAHTDRTAYRVDGGIATLAASVWPAQAYRETPTQRINPHAPSGCRQASDAHGSLGRVRRHCRNARKALTH